MIDLLVAGHLLTSATGNIMCKPQTVRGQSGQEFQLPAKVIS